MNRSIYIGHDPRERDAFAVAQRSILRHLSENIGVHALILDELKERGLYTRPYERRAVRNGSTVLWDTISAAPMSTEHACARFLTPFLAKSGWAMFIDGDTLTRSDPVPMFESLDPSKALYCVKHDYTAGRGLKMDGQIQTEYPRKNWSSVMIFNCDHPSNKNLTLELVNSLPGRDLHRFAWLYDNEIGELDPAWNWLAGISNPEIDPKLVHFTEGVPDMPGYEAQPYANEWRAELMRKAA
jgi:hypothetical protein